jgi:hypothetical protein
VAVINEIGRIRRRDGARAWSICQDIDAVDLWVERFECPTWLDYLRWRARHRDRVPLNYFRPMRRTSSSYRVSPRNGS